MGDHALLTDDELEQAIRAYEAMEWTPEVDERLGALIEEQRARGWMPTLPIDLPIGFYRSGKSFV